MKKAMLLFTIIFTAQAAMAQNEHAKSEVKTLERLRFEGKVQMGKIYLEKQGY